MPEQTVLETQLLIVHDDVAADVALYYETWDYPISYQMLSAQYNKRLKPHFPSTTHAFRDNPGIIIAITKRGKKVIFPSSVAAALKAKGNFEITLARSDENVHADFRTKASKPEQRA